MILSPLDFLAYFSVRIEFVHPLVVVRVCLCNWELVVVPHLINFTEIKIPPLHNKKTQQNYTITIFNILIQDYFYQQNRLPPRARPRKTFALAVDDGPQVDIAKFSLASKALGMSPDIILGYGTVPYSTKHHWSQVCSRFCIYLR